MVTGILQTLQAPINTVLNLQSTNQGQVTVEVVPVPGGGGGSNRAIAGVYPVDQTFGGTTDGSFNAPYKSIQAAVDAATAAGGIAQIILAPATYIDPVSFPVGHETQVTLFEYAGAGAEISGAITWLAQDGDSLGFSGVHLTGGITVNGTGGSGDATLRMENGSCANCIAQGSGVVNVRIECTSQIYNGSDMLLLGTVNTLGAVILQNTELRNGIAHCANLFATTCLIAGPHTIVAEGDVGFRGCEVSGVVTVDTPADVNLDSFSAYEFRSNGLTLAGGATVIINTPAGTRGTQSGSGAIGVNWSNTENVTLTLTGDVTLSFVDPNWPCILNLTVIQDGTGGHSLTFPNTCRTPGGGATAAAPAQGAGAVTKYVLDFDLVHYDWQSALDFQP